jgi:hypothetical protein
MISLAFQPLLPLSADERAVLQDPAVTWAQLVAGFPMGMLTKLAPKYHAAAREFNSRSRKGRPGRPRTRDSAETQAAVAQDAAVAGVVGPGDFVPLGPGARAATTGRSPKPFHSMVIAFLGAAVADTPGTPEHVHRMLHDNPTFASRCGFEYPASPKGRQSRRLIIPSLRTVQRFDQIMAEYGLWGEVRLALARRNLETGALARSDTLCADTTHFEADSTSRVVELPPKKNGTPPLKQRKIVAARAALNKKKKPKETRKVRISRLTKRCRHEEHDACNCPWDESDAGAGVVVKSSSKKYWAHKAAVIGYAGTTIPLDVAVVSHASMHDTTTLEPHLDRLRRILPEAFDGVRFAIADPAYDEAPARERLPRKHGLALITKINPRARKEAALAGHEGRFKLTPQGVPVCLRSQPLRLVGRDERRQNYTWRGPVTDKGVPLCKSCPFAQQCGLQGERRTLRVPRATTPQIDWEHPQHLPSEEARYRLRTAVERQIERVKGPLERNRLPCRGRLRVQAFLDLRLAALHALLCVT